LAAIATASKEQPPRAVAFQTSWKTESGATPRTAQIARGLRPPRSSILSRAVKTADLKMINPVTN